MTDLLGRQPEVGDQLIMGFASGPDAYIRLGIVEAFSTDSYKRPCVTMQWLKSSRYSIPDKNTTVLLRNYVILDPHKG